MRSARSEHVLLVILLAIPLGIAFLGWPAFVKWAAGPTPQPIPEVAGAAATPLGAAVARPTVRPTVAAPETLVPAMVATPQPAKPTQAVAEATRTVAEPTRAAAAPTTQVQSAASTNADGPSEAVQDFYARVAQHDFSAAAELWSPRMRAMFPPQQNIDERFAQTQDVIVRRADVVEQNPAHGRAQVAVDLVESTSVGQRHWSGSWQVVKGPNGWVLDQPALQPN